MENIIKRQEEVDLSADDIKKICDGKVDIVVYHQLNEYNSLQELMGEFGAVCLLYETKQNFGHWTCLLDYPDHIEFFDSYGFAPDQELNYARYDNNAYLTNLINGSSKPVRYSKARLQTFAEEVNTCGRWTSCRIKMRNLTNEQFSSLFKRFRHYTGDFWVSAITFLYTFEKSLNSLG